MPDAPISGLPAATTPLAGTEVLPIVQSGATDKVTVADLTAGRSVSALNFVPTGSTVPANGMYLSAANTLAWATNSTLRVNLGATGLLSIGAGSFGRGAPVTKAVNFTLAATENWVIVNQAGTTTVTLPAASSWTGREVMFKTITANTLISASSNVVPQAGGAAGTAILGGLAGNWCTMVSDGTNWVIMAGGGLL